MTRADTPITRRTYSTYRQGSYRRDLVVTVHSRYLEYHLYNTRRKYLLDHVAAYECAVKLEANQARLEKAEARKRSRTSRGNRKGK